MRQDDRALFDRALRRARASAYAPGEFVGQEGFMTASEIRALAVAAGVGPGATVLDLCCGVAGPGRLLMRELGCVYLGVDASASAVAIARERARDLPCRFGIAHAPPLPAGVFDVVILLETMLAFEDKNALVREIAAALRPRGRFAFTLEEGPPLTTAERAAMPDADTVWLTPLDEMVSSLERAGLVVTWEQDQSRAHRAMAQALAGAFAADAADIAARIGRRSLNDLLVAHRLWVEWLEVERVRKLALVAERASSMPPSPMTRTGCARPRTLASPSRPGHAGTPIRQAPRGQIAGDGQGLTDYDQAVVEDAGIETELAPERVAEMLDRAQAKLIDVRHDYEWSEGRIPGARHIEVNQLAAAAPSIPQDRPVVFYCRSGSRSGMAADAFREAGYDAYNLAGGMVAWAERGLALEPPSGSVAEPRPV
jgi:rhodanese-related sulfurtransferase/SAM-dependent methyltransferase